MARLGGQRGRAELLVSRKLGDQRAAVRRKAVFVGAALEALGPRVKYRLWKSAELPRRLRRPRAALAVVAKWRGIVGRGDDGWLPFDSCATL